MIAKTFDYLLTIFCLGIIACGAIGTLILVIAGLVEILRKVLS